MTLGSAANGKIKSKYDFYNGPVMRTITDLVMNFISLFTTDMTFITVEDITVYKNHRVYRSPSHF